MGSPRLGVTSCFHQISCQNSLPLRSTEVRLAETEGGAWRAKPGMRSCGTLSGGSLPGMRLRCGVTARRRGPGTGLVLPGPQPAGSALCEGGVLVLLQVFVVRTL